MTVETTSTLSNHLSTYYDKVFLERAQYELVHKQGAQMRSMPQNEGRRKFCLPSWQQLGKHFAICWKPLKPTVLLRQESVWM